jgi:hypothetical protein
MALICFSGYNVCNFWCTKQLKIFQGLLGSSKSTFIPGLRVNIMAGPGKMMSVSDKVLYKLLQHNE